jgi:hypothetical protein
MVPEPASRSWLGLAVRAAWIGALGFALWLAVSLGLAWLAPARESVLKTWWR